MANAFRLTQTTLHENPSQNKPKLDMTARVVKSECLLGPEILNRNKDIENIHPKEGKTDI